MAAIAQCSHFPFYSEVLEPKYLVNNYAIRVKAASAFVRVQETVKEGKKVICRKGDVLIKEDIPLDSFRDKPVFIIRNRQTGIISVIEERASCEVEMELSEIFHDKAWRATDKDFRA